jgi:pyrroloquinoline quinone biosynthesis protein D
MDRSDAMSEAVKGRSIGPGERPRLAAKARVQVDRVSGESILLYPEGVLVLNGTGAAIVDLCDGRRRFADLVDELGARYGAPAAALAADVAEYLNRLRDHGLLELLAEGAESS